MEVLQYLLLSIDGIGLFTYGLWPLALALPSGVFVQTQGQAKDCKDYGENDYIDLSYQTGSDNDENGITAQWGKKWISACPNVKQTKLNLQSCWELCCKENATTYTFLQDQPEDTTNNGVCSCTVCRTPGEFELMTVSASVSLTDSITMANLIKDVSSGIIKTQAQGCDPVQFSNGRVTDCDDSKLKCKFTCDSGFEPSKTVGATTRCVLDSQPHPSKANRATLIRKWEPQLCVPVGPDANTTALAPGEGPPTEEPVSMLKIVALVCLIIAVVLLVVVVAVAGYIRWKNRPPSTGRPPSRTLQD